MNDFLITHTTSFSVKEIIDRIEEILRGKKIMIFARISHSQAARDAGLTMQDEELLIFGNPKVGTALMLENPAIGIELPLKIIAWQTEEKSILAYQNLDILAEIFQIKSSSNTISMLKEFMGNLIASAIK